MAKNRTAKVNCSCGHEFKIKVRDHHLTQCVVGEALRLDVVALGAPEGVGPVFEILAVKDRDFLDRAPVREWTMPDLSDRMDAPAITQDDVNDLVRAMNNHDRLAAYAI